MTDWRVIVGFQARLDLSRSLGEKTSRQPAFVQHRSDERGSASASARAPALDSHRAAVAGDAATAALGWSEGSPIEDWGDPRFDHFLVFGDERVVRPRVYLQSEVEWDCEEQQQRLLRAKGGN